MDRDQNVDVEIAPGDVVTLSRHGIEEARRELPDLVAVLEGDRDWFPAFKVPDFEGQTGMTEVSPGRFQVDGFDGGEQQHRLNYFAHMDRIFDWVDDPRGDDLRNLLHESTGPEGSRLLGEASAQDLWDAVFAVFRAERFGDGAVAANAAGITAAANEIRRRLISSRQQPGPS